MWRFSFFLFFYHHSKALLRTGVFIENIKRTASNKSANLRLVEGWLKRGTPSIATFGLLFTTKLGDFLPATAVGCLSTSDTVNYTCF